jgi:uncharacterized protein YggE
MMPKLSLYLTIACTAALFMISCAISQPLYAAEGIRVNGVGAVETVPDIGTLQLHARREGTDPAILEQELSKVISSLLKITRDLNIEAADVTATAVRITPRYQRRDDNDSVEGVIASRSVTVTLRDLSNFPELLQRALAAGINNVDPMSLDTSRRRELEAEALQLAMADAISKAEQVADGFTIERGGAIDVEVNSHRPAPMMAMAEMRADRATPMAPGVIRIDSQVRVTFAIIAP